jgi:YHS domain-containing protein
VVLDPRGAEHLRHVVEPIELFSVRLEDPQLLVDPVSDMAVDPTHALASHRHEDVVYRFCSEACANAFQRDSERYVA